MDMKSMLPMMMMMGQSSSGGGSAGESSIGTDSASMEMMMRLMAPDLFEEDTDALWEDGSTIGHARAPSGETGIGILSLRLLPATMVSAKASLRLSTGGQIHCKPSELTKIGKWLLQVAKQDNGDGTLEDVYASALKQEDTLGPQRTMIKLAGGM